MVLQLTKGELAWGFPSEAFSEALPSNGVAPHLEKGSTVVDHDCDEIGIVKDVEIDRNTGHLERFTVKIGGTLERLFGTAKEVGLLPTGIQRIETNAARLTRGKQDRVPR